MSYQMITEDQQLAQYCQQAMAAASLAIDTEFVRVSTLQPKLGLIQMFDGQTAVLVDPLTIQDWQPFIELMRAPGVLKMLHSCTEDLDAFATIGVTDIQPLMDTQLAAEMIGWGGSMGYARLVEKMTGQQLDKSESRTDWLARPLATTQLDYAANDVLFLWPLRAELLAQLPQPNSLTLLLAEGQQLINRRQRQLPLELKYLELKNSWQFQPRELAVLRALSAWRQSHAEANDIALSLVLKEPLMYELARVKPTTMEALASIEGLHGRDLRRYGQQWLGLIRSAKALAPAECPQTFYHLATFPGFKVVQQQLSDAVKQAAAAAGIPAEILSTKRQLNEYLNWCWRVTDQERLLLPKPEYLGGWRRDILLPYLPVPAQVQSLI